MSNQKRITLLLLPFFLGIGLDQTTKSIAREFLLSGNTLSIFNGLIQFIYIENSGGFLGFLLFIPETIRYWLLTLGVGLIVLALMVILLRLKSLDSADIIISSLVLSGGMSNLIDRVYNDGGVIDFIQIGLEPFTSGIFNLADLFVLYGAFYLGSKYLFRQNRYF